MAEPGAATPALLGRDPELARLVDVVRSGASGRLAAAVVEGEAGIGKSALVRAALTTGPATAATVLVGEASELGRDRRFGPLLDALAATVPDAAAPPGEGGVVDVEVVIGEELVARLERLALDGPVVLAVDDLHWADEASIGLLRTIVRHLADLPLTLVVTLRPTPRASAVDALLEDLVERGAAQLQLRPLPDDVVDQLVAGEVGQRPGPRLSAAIRRTGGNPLYALELVAALTSEGLVDHAELTDDVLPSGMRPVLLRRLSALPPGAIEVLHVAATLGPSFTPGELALVLGRPVVGLLGDLHEAVRSGILGEAGERMVFRHDLLREALYEDLPAATRSAIHLEAFRVLDRAGAAPGRLVPHLLRAAAPDDPETIRLLVDTATAVSTTSPGLAISLYERARDLVRPSSPVGDRAAAGMLVPLVLQGRAPDALGLAREVLARDHDPTLRPLLLEGLAFAILRHAGANRFADEIERAITPDLDDRERRWMEAFLAEARLGGGDGASARRLALEARDWAESKGEDELLVYALGTLAWTYAGDGDVGQAVALASDAVSRRRRLSVCRYNVDVHLGVVLLEADEIDAARARFNEGRTHDTARGDLAATAYYHFGLLGCGYLTGDWDDACAEGEAGLALVDEGVGPPGMSVLGRGLLGRIALHRDDLALAEELIGAAEREMLTNGPQIGGDLVLWVRSLLLEAAGERAAAATVLGAMWDLLAGMRYFMSWRSTAPDLVRLALSAGDRERAEAVVVAAEEGGRRGRGVASTEATALRCRGLLDEDVEVLTAAVERYGASPRRLDTLGCTEELATALATSGRSDDAVPLLREAVDGFDRIGATRDAARVHARLRALGGSRGRGRRSARAATGWESLTPTELDVVALVADGLTNRQVGERLFISRYTVETHLKHVFAKLGLASRVELAAEVIRRRG